MEAYEIQFREAGNNRKIVVAADGNLMDTDMVKPAGAVERLLTPAGATGTQLSALPEKVQNTIQSKAPSAEIANISRLEKDGRVVYEVELRDKASNSTIRVAEDGTLIADAQK